MPGIGLRVAPALAARSGSRPREQPLRGRSRPDERSARALDRLDERAQHLDACEVLVVRFDERPGANVRARTLHHVVHGLGVGRPLVPIAVVLLSDREALELYLLALLEPVERFVLA